MPNTTLNEVKKTIASLLLLAPLSIWAAGSASVDFSIGEVFAVNAASGQRPLGKGALIVSGETVRTGSSGRAQLRFDDGAMISLQPNTEFRLDNYQYAGKQDGNERGFFSLIKGGLRTITGLVGRLNKGNYKVTTSVATIGIRGTEYTLTYLDSETIAIGTGEGAIEVCNGGGCTVLSSGDSAVVGGQNGSVQRVDFRPLLEPAQPVDMLLPDFTTGDFRTSGGAVLLNGGQLQSAAGYAMAYAHTGTGGITTNADAQFAGGAFTAANYSSGAWYQSTTLAESSTLDGVIGWGRWASGQSLTPPSPPATVVTFNNMHYVVGQPTPVSGLNVSATYQLAGYTTPTGALGNSTGAPTGTLTATFTPTTMNVAMALQVPYFNSMTNTTYAVNNSTGTIPIASSFVWQTGIGGGLFAGPNASHAGATYNFSAGGYTNVSGAVVFVRP